ncbi:WecB/TagA/CpsF family glycosyltransferase [Rhodococcoides kyotonense]|uniref:Polymer biosynthesis protein, WecB/TagA/CpsF family n=1 Tax=Rhodococcoides kyotonense TaxID=398843 RepID=A0A239LK85_9NOCA|nr:WecB/TagA/CpsF family glycosyltransferase [Rhodococcus kyotonensis]SNT30986.1 polymer biosynthesis protein, WecB/TagA/CpsF family [Rhodococcus kyotonensis]
MSIDRHDNHGQASATVRMVAGGTPVELCSFETVVEAVTQRLAEPGHVPLALGSVNLDHIHHFRVGPDAANHLDTQRSDLRWAFLADGAPIVSHAEKLTGRSWSRVTGSDLLPAIVDMAAAEGHTVGFLGGTSRMHERLRFALRRSHPDLEVAGFWSPSADELADPAQSSRIAAQISAASVDVLVVGLGKPRQEMWISTYGLATGARLLLAFGAAADFMAGESQRAPRFFQDNGLEWFYRLATEPRRLSRRYLLEGPRALMQLRHAHIEVVDDSPLFGRQDVATPTERSALGGMP